MASHNICHAVPSAFYLSKAGVNNSPTDFAAMVFDNRPHNLRSVKEAEAVFNQNNDIKGGRLSPWDIVNLNPFPLSSYVFNQWQSQKQSISPILDTYPGLFDFLLTTTYEEQQMMLNLAQAGDKSGWKVGKEDILRATGYGVAGMAGYAATGEKSLAAIQRLGNELMNDAVKAHGNDIFQKKNLKTLEAFLKNNPKYNALLKSINDLPGFLSKNLGDIHPSPGLANAAGRSFRSQIALPYYNPQRYCMTFKHLLDSKILRWGRIGTATTWVIPAAIGVYNVYDAPQDQKLKTAASETVGIGFGAGGTELGIIAGAAIASALVLSGPAAFIVIGLVAGAGGALGYEVGSKGTNVVLESMGW